MAVCALDNRCCQEKAREKVYSSVNLLTGDYQDDVEDLAVKALGHMVRAERAYAGGAWLFGLTNAQRLAFRRDATGALEAIVASGSDHTRDDEAGTVYAFGDRRIFVESNGYRRVDGGGRAWLYDPNGFLLRHEDRNGRALRMGYDGQGRLAGIYDHFTNQVLWIGHTNGGVAYVRDQAAGGRQVSYAYDTAGRLTNVVDACGYAWAYGYDASNRLVSKRAPDGRETQVVYRPDGRVQAVADSAGEGKAFEYGYDELRREFSTFITFSDGQVVERWYDEFGNPLRRDLNGVAQTAVVTNGPAYELDERGHVIAVTWPDGTAMRREYDPVLNKVSRETDELGTDTLYAYDARGNLTNLVRGASTAAPRVTRQVFDNLGQLVQVVRVGDTNVADAIMTFGYDSRGNRTLEIDAEGRVTSNAYDRAGRITSVVGPGTSTWTYTYDTASRLVRADGPGGYVVSNVYDAVGNLAVSIGPDGAAATYGYDAAGREVCRTDYAGRVFTRAYDFEGREILARDEEGHEKGAAYDEAGRLVRQWALAGQVRTIEYDAWGRAVRIVSPDGAAHTNVYDAEGRLARVLSPEAEQVARYDARGRMIERIDRIGAEARTNRAVYDAAGRILVNEGPEGSRVAREYNAFGEITAEIRAGVRTNRFDYDAHGNRTRLTDPQGRVTRVEYDRAGRPTRKIYPDLTERTLTYDATGRPRELTDPLNQKVLHLYDGFGRLVQKDFFAATNHTTPARRVTLAYDVFDRMTNWSDGTYGESIVFDDAARRVTRTTDFGAFSRSTVAEYDGLDRVTAFTGPSGERQGFVYDDAGRLREVGIPGEGAITFDGFERGRATVMTLPGGARQELAFSPVALTTSRVLDAAGNLLRETAFEYDREDRLQARTLDGIRREFAYDALGQVAGVLAVAAPPEVYAYDLSGNRVAGPGAGDTWQYSQLNQLTNGPGGRREYDAAGRLALRIDGGGTNAFVFDEDNRLTEIRDGAGDAVARYDYSPSGHRLRKEAGGTETYFLYSPAGLCAELNSTGGVLREYVHAPGIFAGQSPLFVREGGRCLYYVNDRSGAPELVLDRDGAVVWTGARATFGAEAGTGSHDNRLRFSSQYADAESGLHYNTQRYYDPAAGRYLSRDPLEERGGFNAYLFTENDPLNRIDPAGLAWATLNCIDISEEIAAGAYAGVGAEFKLEAKGQICDCCDDETDEFAYGGKITVGVEAQVSIGFGVGLEFEIGPLSFKFALKGPTIGITRNASLVSDCDTTFDQIRAELTDTVDLAVWSAEAEAGLGLGVKDEISEKYQLEVKQSIGLHSYQITVGVTHVISSSRTYSIGPASRKYEYKHVETPIFGDSASVSW